MWRGEGKGGSSVWETPGDPCLCLERISEMPWRTMARSGGLLRGEQAMLRIRRDGSFARPRPQVLVSLLLPESLISHLASASPVTFGVLLAFKTPSVSLEADLETRTCMQVMYEGSAQERLKRDQGKENRWGRAQACEGWLQPDPMGRLWAVSRAPDPPS